MDTITGISFVAEAEVTRPEPKPEEQNDKEGQE